MDLDEYLWRTKTSQMDFAKKLKMRVQAVHNLVHRKATASLCTALKISHVSDGKVGMLDLIKPEDLEMLINTMKELEKIDIAQKKITIKD